MSVDSLDEIFNQFKPTHVFHLAAKANLKGRRIEDFPENTIGTDNVIKCVNACRSIERFIYFSTQYVVSRVSGQKPKNFFYLIRHMVRARQKPKKSYETIAKNVG